MIKKLLIFSLLSPFAAQAATYHSFKHNREGLKHLENKAYYPAYQEFMHALEDDPLNPQVQMNLGLALEANEEFDKAEKAYAGVLKLVRKDSPLYFEALFNLAGVQAKQEHLDQALESYQEALEIQPDSVEVKTNIELLWQGGQGGGKGNKQNKDQQQQQGSNQEQRERSLNQPPEEKQKQQPKPFDSKDMSKEDVKRILDEIKNQEQSIRANEYEKGAKDAPKGKDW